MVPFSDQQKTSKEKIRDWLEKLWPNVYNVTNGFVNMTLGNLKRFLQIIIEQLSGKRF